MSKNIQKCFALAAHSLSDSFRFAAPAAMRLEVLLGGLLHLTPGLQGMTWAEPIGACFRSVHWRLFSAHCFEERLTMSPTILFFRDYNVKSNVTSPNRKMSQDQEILLMQIINVCTQPRQTVYEHLLDDLCLGHRNICWTGSFWIEVRPSPASHYHICDSRFFVFLVKNLSSSATLVRCCEATPSSNNKSRHIAFEGTHHGSPGNHLSQVHLQMVTE